MAKRKLTLKKVVPKAFSTTEAEVEVNTILNDALGQTHKEVLKALTSGETREDIISKLLDTIGKAEGYVQTYVDTGLSVAGRERISEVATDLGLTWYRYIGGVIQTSRDFCTERDGGYYHESEIEGWADEEWDGKIDGTNSETIFSYCGGWNCRHELIPVHESSVPDSYK